MRWPAAAHRAIAGSEEGYMTKTTKTARKVVLVMGWLAAFVAAAGTAAPAEARYSRAYKRGFDLFDAVQLDHTYFCLNDDNDGHDCFSIVGYGVSSSKSGGQSVRGTYRDKTAHERCLARARASNSLTSVCGAMSQLYGINGVCHQHTNRGQLSMHPDQTPAFMDPDEIRGGWWSFIAYGAYGLEWIPCAVASEAQCLGVW
jgi:hypothetical protein